VRDAVALDVDVGRRVREGRHVVRTEYDRPIERPARVGRHFRRGSRRRLVGCLRAEGE
jgi:hypothetical protein